MAWRADQATCGMLLFSPGAVAAAALFYYAAPWLLLHLRDVAARIFRGRRRFYLSFD